MVKEFTFTVEMDEEIKAEVDKLYEDLGLPFTDAIRVFAYMSVRMRGIPFPISLKTEKTRRKLIEFFLEP